MPSERSGDAIYLDDWLRRARDESSAAAVLLKSALWQQSYHHAGFSIECALKYRIMRNDRLNRWPDRTQRQELYIHDLAKLLRIAGLEQKMLADLASDPSAPHVQGWMIAKDWTNETRYDPRPFPERRARDLVDACNTLGLLAWLTT